jgi:MFS superfamily sulfate permease-like transporter
MLYLAVSAVEKLHRVPRQNLINLGLALLVLVVVISLVKVAARMNKFVLFAVIVVLVMVVGFTWVYERNEPKFLSPFIESLTPYFPTRPKY